MDKYVVAPPSGSTNNSVGAVDRPWQKGYFDELPNWQEYLAESTGYGIVSGCTPSISKLTVTVASGIVHLADGTRKEISTSNITLDAADSTNPRIDLVYIDTTGEIAKITGTAAASPSVPALPTSGISVAQISVAANAVIGTLSDNRDMLARWQNTEIVNVKAFGAVGDGVTDDTGAIKSAIVKATETKSYVCFPPGTYLVSSKINFAVSLVGLGAASKDTVIKATADITDSYLVEFYPYGYYKKIENITFDGSHVCGGFGSSYQGSGSSLAYYLRCGFINCTKGVDFSSSIAIAGGLTGAKFQNCRWDGNDKNLIVGNNMDEVNFSNCRFGRCTGNATNPYDIKGNVTFNSCYFALENSVPEYYGLKYSIQIGDHTTSFNRCFWECSADSDLTHIFYCGATRGELSLNDCYFNISANTHWESLIRASITRVDASWHISLNGLSNIAYVNTTIPTVYVFCDSVGANAIEGCTIYLNMTDDFTLPLVSTGVTNNQHKVLLTGFHKGSMLNNYLLGNNDIEYMWKSVTLPNSTKEVTVKSPTGVFELEVGVLLNNNMDFYAYKKFRVINIDRTNTIFTVENVSDLLANGNSWAIVNAITVTKVSGNTVKVAFTTTGTGAASIANNTVKYKVTPCLI